MALQLPFAIAGAGLFGGLGAFGAAADNRNLRRYARAEYDRIDRQTKQQRLIFADQTQIASAQAQDFASSYALAGGSGQSLIESYAQAVGDIETDQARRRDDLRDFEQAQEDAKQSVRNQASSQMQSPLVQGISGAVSGYQIGSQLGGGLDALRQQPQIAAQEAQRLSLARRSLDLAEGGLALDALMARYRSEFSAGQDELGRIELDRLRRRYLYQATESLNPLLGGY